MAVQNSGQVNREDHHRLYSRSTEFPEWYRYASIGDRVYVLVCSGPDDILGGAGSDVLSGGSGNDLIFHGPIIDTSRDVISCGSGYDTVAARSNDVVAADCEDVQLAP